MITVGDLRSADVGVMSVWSVLHMLATSDIMWFLCWRGPCVWCVRSLCVCRVSCIVCPVSCVLYFLVLPYLAGPLCCGPLICQSLLHKLERYEAFLVYFT
jgi:hypothetical protein